ncbi:MULTISPECIES: hypothetical protein [Caballeronia]|uniref:hypothetical protein n=1 Tax=Caballeronia TaxID=1827195 RepID=UPI001FD33DAF|nr:MULTISPECIES: hypothetical protein [Caballeronia]MDR5799149.1 hypothetical protein [Caballeronia sp. LZ001]
MNRNRENVTNIELENGAIRFDLQIDDEVVPCELCEEALIEAADVSYVVSRQEAFARVQPIVFEVAAALARANATRPIRLTGHELTSGKPVFLRCSIE